MIKLMNLKKKVASYLSDYEEKNLCRSCGNNKLSDKALAAMMPFLGEVYQNPSTLYSSSRHIKRAIAEARAIVAESIGAKNTKEEVDIIVTQLIQIVESMNKGR